MHAYCAHSTLEDYDINKVSTRFDEAMLHEVYLDYLVKQPCPLEVRLDMACDQMQTAEHP